MGIERKHPVKISYAPTFQLLNSPVEAFKTTPVVTVERLEKLFEALSEECKSWQQSDGKIWWDSPESWLSEQLGFEKQEKVE